MVQTLAFQLRLKPWTWLMHAEMGALYHKVQLDLQGIPLHAWEPSMVADLLRPFCMVERFDADSLSRHNLEFFRVTTRTTRPKLIRWLAIPEPSRPKVFFEPERSYLSTKSRSKPDDYWFVSHQIRRLPPPPPFAAAF